MTLYRITIDLTFTQEDPVEDIWDKARDHIPEACTIHPGEPNQEQGFMRRIVCGHADNPNQPCTPEEEILAPLTPCPGVSPPP